jgi:hypothetical protein
VEPSHLSPNLLVRLSRYAPTSKATPLENFVTEAFAYLLRACRPVREAFLIRFCGLDVRFGECSVTTQELLPDGSRPDLCIQAGKERVHIENKVWSDLNQYESEAGETIDQIRKYVDAIPESELPTSRVKLITSRPVSGLVECRNGALVFSPARDHIRWARVYTMLTEVANSCTPVGAFLVGNFQALMEEYDMAPFEGVGRNLREIAESYGDVNEAARKLRKRLASEFTTLLDGIIEQSGLPRGRHSFGDNYVGATVNVGKEGLWLGVYFTVSAFLKLHFLAFPRTYRKLAPDDLSRLRREGGYDIDKDRQLGRSIELPEAAGTAAADEQIRCGAEFLKAEVAVWQELLRREA